MNFIEQASRNKSHSPLMGETDGGNYYAFFDKPVPENLAANRNGILTPQQQSALDQHVASLKGSISLVAGMFLCVIAVAFFIFWKVDGEDGVHSFENLLLSTGAVTILVGILTYYLTGDWFVFFARDDLEGGAVESAVGKVIWDGKRYQMRTDTRQLRTLRHGVIPPAPGEYRFYYLPHTGLVVMAEEARDGIADETSSALFQALASANDFSPEDLAQNQKGLLSRHQENRLIRFIALYGLVLLGGVVLLLSLRFQILRALSTTTSILLLIVGMVLLVRFGWGAIKILMDLWHGRVSSVEGLVVRQSHRSRYRRSYYYVVDTFKFEVSEAAYNALVEGVPYCIWYVPRSKRLVSIGPKW